MHKLPGGSSETIPLCGDLTLQVFVHKRGMLAHLDEISVLSIRNITKVISATFELNYQDTFSLAYSFILTLNQLSFL